MIIDRVLATFRYSATDRHLTDGTFGFSPMDKDPLAQLFLGRMRLRPLGIFAVGIALVAIAHLAAIAAYWLFLPQSLGNFVSWQFGEWSVVVSFWFAYPFVVAFYPWAIWTSGNLLERLRRDGVLEQEAAPAVEKARKVMNHAGWTVGAIGLGLVLEALILLDGFDGSWARIPQIGADYWLFNVVGSPINLVGLYVILVVTGRYLSVLIGLFSVFRPSEELASYVRLRPWHPDRCGGLGAMSDYAVTIGWFIASVGFLLSLFLYVSVVFIAPIDHISSDASIYETLKLAVLANPTIWLAILLYLVVSPILFFTTLSAPHRSMQATKIQHLRLIAQRLDREYQSARTAVSGDQSPNDNVEAIKNLRDLYALTQSFPVWPFDFTTVRRFGTAFLAPFLTIAATAMIEQVGKRIMHG